jgi:D-alanyl-D-alanine carboxypeptidase/D-alanyl-D-alanine-endopeptidase (penicillin-binding protein 4)
MTRAVPLIIAAISISVSSFARADDGMAERLKKAVNASGFKAGELGLWVGTASGKGKQLETYYALNADKLFIPASLSKIPTAGAVLNALHPGFKFKTQLVSDAKVENGNLGGALFLKGGGDPSFVSENMWFLVNELTRTGVKTIEGDVVVDDSRFDTIRFGDDRQDERVDRAYDAPIGAMSMNWNAVNVYVRPGDKVGDKLRVFADVSSPYLKVRNETRTAAAGKGKNVGVERTSEKGFSGDVIVVSGGMAIDQGEAVVYKSISNPDQWSGSILVEFLRQRGIEVKGKVRTGAAPKSALVLATSESRSLTSAVADMGKWSNNYVAEMLIKNLSAEAGDAPGTMTGGMARVIKYLEGAGLKKDEFEFINAAGFTRKNKFTPQQLGRVLEHIHADFTIFPEFLSSLPIAGVDGTLRNRMKNSRAERWVRAKTGLLNGVVGLAGFAGRPAGRVVSFAFIYNGAAGREDKARALFDRMAASIVED